MPMGRPAMWKLAGLGLLGFCAVSAVADRVNLGPTAAEAAGFCGAFLGALAGRRITQHQKALAGGSAAEPAETLELSNRV
jgi:hypothetical protein